MTSPSVFIDDPLPQLDSVAEERAVGEPLPDGGRRAPASLAPAVERHARIDLWPDLKRAIERRQCSDEKPVPRLPGDQARPRSRAAGLRFAALVAHEELAQPEHRPHGLRRLLRLGGEARPTRACATSRVIVGGGKRGVVTTACYIARMSGVALGHADVQGAEAVPRRRGPSSPTSPSTSPRAGASSAKLRGPARPWSQPLSLDEAWIDLSGTERLHGGAAGGEAGPRCRSEIEDEIGLTVSIGLAPNKFLAKIASELDKPRGFSVIGAARRRPFLAPQPVPILPGVGPVPSARLAGEAGYARSATSPAPTSSGLAKVLRRGTACGCITWPTAATPGWSNPDQERKTISAETTFNDDLDTRRGPRGRAVAAVREGRPPGPGRRGGGPGGDAEAAHARLQDPHPPPHPARADPDRPHPVPAWRASCWRPSPSGLHYRLIGAGLTELRAGRGRGRRLLRRRRAQGPEERDGDRRAAGKYRGGGDDDTGGR